MAVPSGGVPAETQTPFSPAYWEGHSLGSPAGISEVHSWPEVLPKENPFAAYAKTTLEKVLRLKPASLTGEPVRELEPGESFDWREHAPGTVIIFNEETLLQRDPDLPVDNPESGQNGDVAESPIDLGLPTKLGDRRGALSQQLISGNTVYEVLVRGGVVIRPDWETSNRLVTLNGAAIRLPSEGVSLDELKAGQAKVKVSRSLGRLRLEPAPLAIGAVRHYAGPQLRMARVNALAIVTPGQPDGLESSIDEATQANLSTV